MRKFFLQIYKAICTKIEDLKNIELNTLPVYDDRYIKAKIRTYSHKVYTKFRVLNVPGDEIKCETFTLISIRFLLIYENKYYLQVYLDNCAYKVGSKQIVDIINDVLL